MSTNFMRLKSYVSVIDELLKQRNLLLQALTSVQDEDLHVQSVNMLNDITAQVWELADRIERIGYSVEGALGYPLSREEICTIPV